MGINLNIKHNRMRDKIPNLLFIVLVTIYCICNWPDLSKLKEVFREFSKELVILWKLNITQITQQEVRIRKVRRNRNILRDYQYHLMYFIGSFTTEMLVRKDLLAALQYNFSTIGALSLMLGPEVQDAVAVSTRVYQHYLGSLATDRDHIEELTKVTFSSLFCLMLNLSLIILMPVLLRLVWSYSFPSRNRNSISIVA